MNDETEFDGCSLEQDCCQHIPIEKVGSLGFDDVHAKLRQFLDSPDCHEEPSEVVSLAYELPVDERIAFAEEIVADNARQCAKLDNNCENCPHYLFCKSTAPTEDSSPFSLC